MPLPPIETIHLFSGERRELISLLRSLTPQEWMLPTPCAGWSVHDVAIHVLGDDIGKISGSRDSHPNPEFATGINITSFAGLVAAIDRQNDQWVKASRRISPALTIELLGFTGSVFINHVRTLDLDEIRGSVDWAGPEPAPVWMDLAREYTERWHHQQHIREAVGKPGMMERRWLRPVFETFIRGLNRSLSTIHCIAGTTLMLSISGDAGGNWTATYNGSGWDLTEQVLQRTDASVTMPPDIAWKLFTRGVPVEEAKASSIIEGDRDLADGVFRTVSILAE